MPAVACTYRHQETSINISQPVALLTALYSHFPGPSRNRLEAELNHELALLRQAVSDTAADPLTKPGEGIGIYSPGYKRLGQIE